MKGNQVSGCTQILDKLNMVDTIGLSLETGLPDQFVSALDNPEYRTKKGQTCTRIQGKLENLSVSIREHDLGYSEVFLSGSLAKFLRGNNAETLTRSATQEAVGKLSDLLSCDIGGARVRTLDIGRNLLMKHRPEQYFSFLCSAPYMTKIHTGNTLYFQNGIRKLAFYDKCEELVRSKTDVPECFSGGKVLRYEQRIKKGLPKLFKRSEVLFKDLYSEKMYSDLVQSWKEAYFSVKKQKQEGVILNMTNVNSLMNDLAFLGVLHIGADQVRAQIDSAYKSGLINRQQKHRYLSKLNEIAICENRENTSDLIRELDQKVSQSVRYAR